MRKLTRRDRFLAEVDSVTPWRELHKLIEPYYPKAAGPGSPRIGLARMLRMYVAQQCFGLSNEALKTPFTTARRFALMSELTSIARAHRTRRRCSSLAQKPTFVLLDGSSEMAHLKVVEVHIDSQVALERHCYSAPHSLVGQVLEARTATALVELMHRDRASPAMPSTPARLPAPRRLPTSAPRTGRASKARRFQLISSQNYDY
jgi:hypothetical protein